MPPMPMHSGTRPPGAMAALKTWEMHLPHVSHGAMAPGGHEVNGDLHLPHNSGGGDAMPSSILVTSRITGQCTCPIILRLTWHRVPLRIRAKCIYPSIRRYHGARYHGDPENNRVMHLFHGPQGALSPTHPRKMGNAFTILFLG